MAPKRNQPRSLKHSTYGQNRSTGGAFTPDEFAAFFLGVWTPCRSTQVASARYLSEDSILEVEFKAGPLYQYPGLSEDMAESFASAPSKRGWIWDYVDRQGGEALRVI